MSPKKKKKWLNKTTEVVWKIKRNNVIHGNSLVKPSFVHHSLQPYTKHDWLHRSILGALF